jgi:hypothetical protein
MPEAGFPSPLSFTLYLYIFSYAFIFALALSTQFASELSSLVGSEDVYGHCSAGIRVLVSFETDSISAKAATDCRTDIIPFFKTVPKC